MDLVVINFIEILLILFIFNKKINNRLDPSLLFVVIMLGYFYPILFFSHIYVFKCGEYSVSFSLKIYFFVQLISFLLFRMLFFSIFKHKRENFFINLKKLKFFFKTITVINLVLILSIILKLKGNFYFTIHNKVLILKSLGILEPLYHTSALLLLTLIFLYKELLWNTLSKILIVINIAFDVSLGFRYILYWTLINFLLFKKITIKSLMLFILIAFLLLLAKVTNYFTNFQIFSLIFNNFNEFLFKVFISFAEQSSINLILNEVVEKNFQIPLSYLIEVSKKFIPFMETTNFGDLYKQVLFGECAKSFASGNLAIIYAIWNSYTILYLINNIIFLGLLISNLIKPNFISINLIIKSFIIGVIFFYYFRGDLQADIIYLRNIVFFVLGIEVLFFLVKKKIK